MNSTGGTDFDMVFLNFAGDALAAQYSISVTQPNPQSLRLTRRVDQQQYAEVLREVMYENTADEPGSVVRSVVFTIVDSIGFIGTATTNVQIIPTNDRAVINFSGGPRSLSFSEHTRQSVSLFDENDNITDSDGDSLQWLSIHITPGIDEYDILTAEEGETGLTVTVTATGEGEVLLNISGYAAFSVYESVLSTVTFVNMFPGISQAQRNVEVVAFDGETPSAIHPITIAIVGFNDPPMCFFDQEETVPYAHLPPSSSTPSQPEGFSVSTLDLASFPL